jgi:hypothetical protein
LIGVQVLNQTVARRRETPAARVARRSPERGDVMGQEFWAYAAIGFLAQIIDGTLGMAFGIIVSSSLLAFGATPAFASAAVHTAEIATTGASALSHGWHGNVDKRLLVRLATAGVAGGVLGAYVLVDVLPREFVRPLVTAYLLGMAVLIFERMLRRRARKTRVPAAPLGFAGGFLDAIGGGGWGPMVASSLMATGDEPRRSVGTANAAEFFVAASVSATFLATIDFGELWRDVLAIILGGIAAAPLGGWLIRIMPPRLATILVAGVVLCLSLYNVVRLEL